MHKAVAVMQIIWDYFGHELVMTAGTENPKEHMENSRHAYGDAVDGRTRYFMPDIQNVIEQELKNKLKIIGNYTVIFHDNHAHVQYNRV